MKFLCIRTQISNNNVKNLLAKICNDYKYSNRNVVSNKCFLPRDLCITKKNYMIIINLDSRNNPQFEFLEKNKI